MICGFYIVDAALIPQLFSLYFALSCLLDGSFEKLDH